MKNGRPNLWWRIAVAGALIVGAVCLWVILRFQKEQASQRSSASGTQVSAPLPGLSPEELAKVQGGHPRAMELNVRDGTPEKDLEILREMLLSFTTSLKVVNLPPLGDNIDVTAALTGHNKMKLVVIPPNHPSVDAKGHLLDRWGTPYHFHARSADSFDLRSAGPDKVLFTADDVTWVPGGKAK